MRRRRLLAVVAAAALLTGVAPAVAQAGDPIMPLSELRPGMRCTAYSVVRGTEISSFDVEIVDVVSGDASANDGPRILVRLSGAGGRRDRRRAGLLGLADLLPRRLRHRAQRRRDLGVDRRLRRQDRARHADRGDPRQPSRGAPRPKPIGARASRIGRVLPLAEPLTVSGLSRGLARKLTEAGAKARRTVLAAPALPLAPFPAAPPRPGSSLSVGYSSGDIAVGAVGTVAYVDGDRVWGFGHPFENSGLRSLLLQDAYVYDVISNPNVGEDTGSTYKLAAPGHTLGTISNDASAAVVGRSGPPPATVPVRIFIEDEDTGARSTLGARVTDETDVGTPTGSSALTFVAPLALAQGASAILRSAPGQLSGTVCVRIALRERKRPLRFCNRYASAIAPSDTEAGENIVAAGAASDALTRSPSSTTSSCAAST